MSHAYHEAEPGFDERQILYDGCPECMHRSADPTMFLAHADNATFARAWKRAFDWKASRGGGYDVTGDLSHAEVPILNILWGIQVAFERAGVPLNGEIPR
jgi:hypothetical protein